MQRCSQHSCSWFALCTSSNQPHSGPSPANVPQRAQVCCLVFGIVVFCEFPPFAQVCTAPTSSCSHPNSSTPATAPTQRPLTLCCWWGGQGAMAASAENGDEADVIVCDVKTSKPLYR